MAFFQKEKDILEVPVKYIYPNPDQPRKYIDRKGIEALAESIKENGLINPITLKKEDKNKYFIICGERRYRAFCLLGRETIPAIIKNPDDISVSALALVENTQRAGLSFLEEAMAIKEFLDESSLSQADCAKRLGISQASVANKLRILRLPKPILRTLAENGFTERHARALLSLEGNDLMLEKVCKKTVEESLTVRQLEKLCEKEKMRKKNPPIVIIKDLRVFTSSITSAVSLMKKAGYKITSDFRENEDDITCTIVIPKKSYDRKAI